MHQRRVLNYNAPSSASAESGSNPHPRTQILFSCNTFHTPSCVLGPLFNPFEFSGVLYKGGGYCTCLYNLCLVILRLLLAAVSRLFCCILFVTISDNHGPWHIQKKKYQNLLFLLYSTEIVGFSCNAFCISTPWAGFWAFCLILLNFCGFFTRAGVVVHVYIFCCSFENLLQGKKKTSRVIKLRTRLFLRWV